MGKNVIVNVLLDTEVVTTRSEVGRAANDGAVVANVMWPSNRVVISNE